MQNTSGCTARHAHLVTMPVASDTETPALRRSSTSLGRVCSSHPILRHDSRSTPSGGTRGTPNVAPAPECLKSSILRRCSAGLEDDCRSLDTSTRLPSAKESLPLWLRVLLQSVPEPLAERLRLFNLLLIPPLRLLPRHARHNLGPDIRVAARPSRAGGLREHSAPKLRICRRWKAGTKVGRARQGPWQGRGIGVHDTRGTASAAGSHGLTLDMRAGVEDSIVHRGTDIDARKELLEEHRALDALLRCREAATLRKRTDAIVEGALGHK